MERKALCGVQIKDADRGEIAAVFATFGVVDHDRDVVLREAFTEGQEIVISAYNHASWGPNALPVGRGKVRTTQKAAILEGKFFDTAQARDTFAIIKELGDLQEYSWGFDVVEWSFEERNGKQIRILQKVDLHEVSPVLKGSSIGTRTLTAKSRTQTSALPRAVKRAIPAHDTAVVARLWDLIKTQGMLPADPRPSQLRSVYAWVDPDGDTEDLASYRLAHHHGVDGPANLRACLTGIAMLNSAKSAGIPDTDSKAVYEHLAAHLRDADREPPELRDRGTGATKFSDELLEGLATVSGLIDAASRVVALRRVKGKGLSKGNAEILDWIGDDMGRLKALLSHPVADDEPQPTDEEIASIVAASFARIYGI